MLTASLLTTECNYAYKVNNLQYYKVFKVKKSAFLQGAFLLASELLHIYGAISLNSSNDIT